MKSAHVARVAVVGANSQIGQFLIPRLEARGITVFRIGRKSVTSGQHPVHSFDERHAEFHPPLSSVDAIISLAPLPHIDSVLNMAAAVGAKRLIAFGSTGRFSKSASPSTIEQDFVAQQIQAEARLEERGNASGVAWTLFRPTMIYGAELDQNISFIASFIRRFGFFPIAFGANGLRQPVHADDLAGACVSALDCEGSFNRAYNLGGGERLSYRDLVCHIFKMESKNPRILYLPRFVFELAVNVFRNLKKYQFVRPEMVQRMFDDLVVDNSDAESDFGYTAKSFRAQNHITKTPNSL